MTENISNYDRKKEEILSLVKEAAPLYKAAVVNKTFLIVFEKGYIELIFKVQNFSHLCGKITNLYAKDFYHKALYGNLTSDDIEFDEERFYEYAIIKLTHIEEALNIFNKKMYIAQPFDTDSALYEYGATNKTLTLCLNKENNKYIPYSLRVKNIDKERYADLHEVKCVFTKETTRKLYNNLIFFGVKQEDIITLLKKHDLLKLISVKLKE